MVQNQFRRADEIYLKFLGIDMDRSELIEIFNRKAGPMGWDKVCLNFPDAVPDGFFPDGDNIFKALEQIEPSKVKYIVLGQDPYYTYRNDIVQKAPHATGVAFAVDKSCADIPPSLKCLVKNLYDSCSVCYDLQDWIQHKGVLLLNAALTVPIPENGINPRKVAGAHLQLWRSFVASIVLHFKGRIPDNHFVAWGLDARSILDDTFRTFSWSYHPSLPHYGKEKSFNEFWKSSIGSELSMAKKPSN